MSGSTHGRIAKSQTPQTHMPRVPNISRRSGEASHAHPLLHLQKSVGNHAFGRLIEAKLSSTVFRQEEVAEAFSDGSSAALTQPAPVVQTKLTINEPGDGFEQEADSTADRVMRMSAPTGEEEEEDLVQTNVLGSALQRECAGCAEEEMVQRQEVDEEEILQTKPLMRKATDGGGYTATPRLASYLNRTKGSGHVLPAPTLAFMNRAFGVDFSPVRIHTGNETAEMSRGIHANAFTHGTDIYFNTGKYNPTTAEGNKLLAHELTHTIQQSANVKRIAAKRQEPQGLEQRVSGRAEVIQRDMGLEFQANNVISQKKGKKRFQRLETKGKPLRKIGGLSMEVDTGSVMEFGTGHYKKWSDLKKDLDAVSAIIKEITGLPKKALNPAKAVTANNPLVFRGFKTAYGKVDITANPGNFYGRPQSNEEIVLSEFGSMLKEHQPKTASTVTAKTRSVFGKKATSPNLNNFMQIIISHLLSLQQNFVIYQGAIVQPKAFLALMNKTDYTAMFQALSRSDQNEFKKLVNADPNPIAKAAGVSMKDDLFKVGYWGWHPDRANNRVLIKQGKIVMIQKKIPRVVGQGTNKDIHKCGDKGVPRRYCTTKKPIEQVTVGAWLKSMITPSRRTKKSITAPLPTYAGTTGAGFSWGLKKVTSPGMFLFEMRGYKGMPIADWPDFAEDKFNRAANCRPGSKLKYDGKKRKPKC